MKISVNTIQGMNKRYGSAGDIAPDGLPALATRIGAQLGAIEEIIDLGARFKGIVVVKVVTVTDHPNADRLHICMIDDGGKVQGVERDAEGLVQVVCGAPNVRDGLTVAWLPPGSTVPESLVKGEPFVLTARNLRGVVSNGMLASPRELTLGDSHEGILEINIDVEPGSDFAEAFELAGDTVFDIENKMFTHRPDCFGFLGVSRELAGIQQLPFKSPDWYRSDATVPAIEGQPLKLTICNELPELVPRFTAVVMRNVAIKSSPTFIQIELAKVGLRPINNVVDWTNFFMLETGQPLHAYDYDKVKALDGANADGATIVVRHPKPGEKLLLLNGKEITPRDEAIMICSDTAPIGLGGVMGGGDTEVDDTTKNIIIEVANFDMYSIRRTSMAHGLFTDAVTRFNKGQSPLQNRAVLAKMINEVQRYAGGEVASELIDDCHLAADVLQRNSLHPTVEVTAGYINERLGLQLSADEIRQLLTNVEFAVTMQADKLQIVAPFWRTDIEIPEDIVEEVGRLYGFDKLPLVLPKRPMSPTRINQSFAFKQRIRDALSQAGANEVLSYSFVHGNTLTKAGQDSAQSYKLSNALSPDLQYYRQSLMPSLLEMVHPNVKAGNEQFALFEIGKGHCKGQLDENGDPVEFERVALVFAAAGKLAQDYAGAPYYQAKLYLEQLLTELDVLDTVEYMLLEAGDKDSAAKPFEPGRAATIRVNGIVLGRIGEYRNSVRKAWKLPEFCAGFEIGILPLTKAAKDAGTNHYRRLSKFPKVEQDICLKVAADKTYASVYSAVKAGLTNQQDDSIDVHISPVDTYQRPDDVQHKQVTLRITVVSHDKTLRDTEVSAMLDVAAAEAASSIGAQRI